MDEIYAALCAKLSENGTGKYCVFYEDELLDLFPQDERTRDALEAALTRLVREGCIDVRYARGSAFCIACLKPFVPRTPLPPAEVAKPAQGGRRALAAVCLAAFAGSALASGIVALFGGIF